MGGTVRKGERGEGSSSTSSSHRAALHTIHSTGHETCLARTFAEHFGDEQYSKEELIAETGAASLSAVAGTATQHTEQNTTGYIQHWIEALKQYNRLIHQAGSAAQRAVDVITGQSLADSEGTDGEAYNGFPKADGQVLAA